MSALLEARAELDCRNDKLTNCLATSPFAGIISVTLSNNRESFQEKGLAAVNKFI